MDKKDNGPLAMFVKSPNPTSGILLFRLGEVLEFFGLLFIGIGKEPLKKTIPLYGFAVQGFPYLGRGLWELCPGYGIEVRCFGHFLVQFGK
jgi:hypothetical protein